MKKLSSVLFLFVCLGGVSAQADSYSYSGVSGGSWSDATQWFDTTTSTTGASFPHTSSDTALLNLASGSQTVINNASVTDGTLTMTNTSTSTSSANILDLQGSSSTPTVMTLTSATLTAGSGGTNLIILDTTAANGASTLVVPTLTLTSGDTLEMTSFATSIQQPTSTLTGSLVLNGGNLNVDKDKGTNSAPVDNISGGLTMTTGSINLGTLPANTGLFNPRLTIGGTVNITGGTVNNASQGLFLAGFSNTIKGITQTGATGLSISMSAGSGTQTLDTDQAITNLLTIRTFGAGTATKAVGNSSSGTLSVNQITMINGFGGAVVGLQLNSNITTTIGNANGVIAAAFSSSPGGLTVDTNGHVLDMTASTTSGFVPTNMKNTAGTAQATNWTLQNTGGSSSGQVKATFYNLSNPNSTTVGANTNLIATGGNGTANILSTTGGATASFSSSSTFQYAGTAVKGSAATVASSATIGQLQVNSGFLNTTGNSGLLTTGGGVTVSGATSGLQVNGTSVGTLTINSGNFSLGSGSTLQLTVSSTLGNDTIGGSAGGSFTLNGVVSFDNTLTSGDYLTTYNIFTGFGGTNSVSGLTFDSASYNSAAYTASISTSGILSFSAVPEPSAWALLLAGFASLVLLQRRRRTFIQKS